MTKIGFAGIGNMGLPMAKNLIAHSDELLAFDVSDKAREAAHNAGLTVADSCTDVAIDADIVITMLPNGEIAGSVADELLKVMPAGSLLIDCSTIDVTSARGIHEKAQKSGKLSLDAPVSGGVGGASDGTLTFMVGGSTEAFAKGESTLGVLGQKAVHCGEGGSGQAAKICNNMLLGISMIGTCEAFALAEKLGLDQNRLFDVVSTSSGSCWSVNTYCPVPQVGPTSPSDNNYQPGFSAALMLKDLSLAMQAASEAGATTTMGAKATELYKKMNDLGHGNVDFSAMITLLSQLGDGTSRK